MAYATISQVQARNAARGTFTQNTVPNASQVSLFVLEAAAQLDTWLIGAGYAAPFDSAIASAMVPSVGVAILERWNVTGAALMVEESAVSSDRIDHYRKMWDEIKAAIFDKTQDIPLPMNPAKANPRGLGVPGSIGTGTAQEFTFSKVTPGPFKGAWDL